MTDIVWTACTVTLGALKPWAANPRMSTKAQAKRILASFAKFGQVQAVAIGPENEVYDGHQRLSALLTIHGPNYQIDARRSSRALTDDERRALVVTLHAGAVGAWDWDMLAGWEAPKLQEWGLDKDTLKQWGADTAALATMLEAEKPEPAEDPGADVDRAEELREKWGVQPGQLWQLGAHRLICGDCTDAATVARVMGGEKASAVLTDSPYGMDVEGVENDSAAGLDNLFDGALSVLPISNGVVVNFQGARLFWKWIDAVRAHGHRIERALWMYKPNDGTFPWRGWLQTGQIILLSSVGKPAWGGGEYKHDTYIENFIGTEIEKAHATPKPIEVVSHILGWICGDGAMVYEPFSGSGTTILACERLGRRCRAVEISPAYVAVALERWATMTGRTPVLVG